MSDLRVREFERRWLAEGTFGAWNAWANALARAGDDVLVQVRERAKKWHSHHSRSIRVQIRHFDREYDYEERRRFLELREVLRYRDLRLLRAFCRAANRADRQGMAVELTPWLDISEQHRDAEAIAEAVANTSWNYYGENNSVRRRRPILGIERHPVEKTTAASDAIRTVVQGLRAAGVLAEGDPDPSPADTFGHYDSSLEGSGWRRL